MFIELHDDFTYRLNPVIINSEHIEFCECSEEKEEKEKEKKENKEEEKVDFCIDIFLYSDTCITLKFFIEECRNMDYDKLIQELKKSLMY